MRINIMQKKSQSRGQYIVTVVSVIHVQITHISKFVLCISWLLDIHEVTILFDRYILVYLMI
jgi:hypothetical protein